MKRKLESSYQNINYFYNIILTEPSLLTKILKYFKLSEIENIYRLLYTDLKNDIIYTILEKHITKNYLDDSFIQYNNALFMRVVSEYNFKLESSQMMIPDFIQTCLNYQNYTSTKNIVLYGLCQFCKKIPSKFGAYGKNMVTKVKHYSEIELEPEFIILCNDCMSKKPWKEMWMDANDLRRISKSGISDAVIIAKKYNIRAEYSNQYHPAFFCKDVNERIVLQQLQDQAIEIQKKINLIKNL